MNADFHTVYGVEVAGGRLSVVRVRRRRGQLHQDVLLDRADLSAGWQTITAELSAARKQGGAAVAFAAPASDSFIRPVQVPFSSETKARAVLPSLLDVQLPFPLEQCVYDFGAFDPAPGGKIDALAVAMLKSRLRDMISELAGTGIDPEWIVPEALALWRYHAMHTPATGPAERLVVQLADDRTIAVAGRSGRPLASFSSRTGWVGSSELAREKLMARLKQFVAGFTRGTPQALELVISGTDDASAATFTTQLGFDPAQRKIAGGPALMAAAAACLVMESGGLPVNMRRGEFESPALILHRKRRDRASWSLVAAAAVILLLVCGAAKWVTGNRVEQIDADILSVARELTGGQAQLYSEIHAVRNDPVIGGWLRPAVMPLFSAILKSSAGAGLSIETIKIGKSEMIIRGAGSDWNSAGVLTNAIAGVTAWNVVLTPQDAGPDEKVHFIVRASP